MLRLLLAVGVLVTSIATVVAAGEKEPVPDKKTVKLTATEKTLVDLVNKERAKMKLSQLVVDPVLCRVARQHTLNMAKQEKMEHMLDGKGPAQRALDAGYDYLKIGENLARAFAEDLETPEPEPADIHKKWMASKKHHDNIVHPKYTEVGIFMGRSKKGNYYYTMMFGKPDSDRPLLIDPMDTERTLLEALHADPQDAGCWLVLSDALEELGQVDRATLLRLRGELLHARVKNRNAREAQLRALLDKGVRPPVPTLTVSLGLQLALVPAGSFRMGSPRREPGRHLDEHPRHAVKLTRSFYLGIFPVTQEQYEKVTRSNPSNFRAAGEGSARVQDMDTSSFPVEQINWEDARKFCRGLSELPAEKSAKRVYRLPTEAEWEYACRAGTTTYFYFGNALGSDRANIDGSLPLDAEPGGFLERTTAVGSYPPNAFGLFDMHGNVWEWCQDWFDESYYPVSAPVDPTGPADGTRRVLRGGSWFWGARICRSAYRYRYEPDTYQHGFGMRVGMDAVALTPLSVFPVQNTIPGRGGEACRTDPLP